MNVKQFCIHLIFIGYLGGSITLQAQAGVVFGINNDHFVKVNLETAALEPIFKLNLPSGADFRNLVYIPKDTSFYSIIYSDTKPSLVRINHNGQWRIIDAFKVGQQLPQFSKALTYNKKKDELLVSLSLDAQVNDSKAEALAIVNRQTAACTVLATIRQLPPPDDFEKMAVYNNQLFCFDSNPDHDITYIYPFHLDQLKGELFCGSKQNIPFFTMEDVLVINDVVYFTDSRYHRLYYFNLIARKWLKVGQFHGSLELGKIHLTGLALMPFSRA